MSGLETLEKDEELINHARRVSLADDDKTINAPTLYRFKVHMKF